MVWYLSAMNSARDLYESCFSLACSSLSLSLGRSGFTNFSAMGGTVAMAKMFLICFFAA